MEGLNTSLSLCGVVWLSVSRELVPRRHIRLILFCMGVAFRICNFLDIIPYLVVCPAVLQHPIVIVSRVPQNSS